jgi:DNA-binding IclR family transcriptional regulator
VILEGQQRHILDQLEDIGRIVVRRTPRTIVDQAKLREMMAEVRQHGFAIEN